LLPTSGGDHARRAEGYAASLLKETGGSLTVLSIEGTMVADGRAHDNLRQAGERLTALGLGAEVEKALVKHDSVPQAIIEQARAYDALVIGATRDSYSRQVLFGSIPEKVAKEAEHSVIVVKAHDPLRAFVGRVVGE
jgi:nucleotide-binding universal stress UspA family protein